MNLFSSLYTNLYYYNIDIENIENRFLTQICYDIVPNNLIFLIKYYPIFKKITYHFYKITDILLKYRYESKEYPKEMLIQYLNDKAISNIKLFANKDKIDAYLNKHKIIKKFYGENSLYVSLSEYYLINKVIKNNSNGKIFFKTEVTALISVINEKHFPKVIYYTVNNNENTFNIYMTFCGVPINKNNKPKDWYKQYLEIKEIIIRLSLVISDIQTKNICIFKDIIYLIDLGFAHIGTELEVKRDISILYNTLKHI